MDFGEGVAVSRVTIFNRNDGDANHAAIVSARLSNSEVSLLNYQGTTIMSYSIGDAINIPMFDISFDSTAKSFCGNYACTQAVWDAIANGHSCGARMTWLQSHEGKTAPQACRQVASEFPAVCVCAPSNEFTMQDKLDEDLLQVAQAAAKLKSNQSLLDNITKFNLNRFSTLNRAERDDLKRSTIAELALLTDAQFNDLLGLGANTELGVPALKIWNERRHQRSDYCILIQQPNSQVPEEIKMCMCGNSKPFVFCMILLEYAFLRDHDHQARQRQRHLRESHQQGERSIGGSTHMNRTLSSKAFNRDLQAKCSIATTPPNLFTTEPTFEELLKMATGTVGIGISGECSMALPPPLNFLEAQLGISIDIPDFGQFSEHSLTEQAGILKVSIAGKLCLAFESLMQGVPAKELEELMDAMDFFGIDPCFLMLR
jgi:hypothetical protein